MDPTLKAVLIGIALAAAAPVGVCQVGLANDTCSTSFGPVGDGFYTVDTTAATESGVEPLGLPPFVDDFTPNTACQDLNGAPEDMNADVWLLFSPSNSGRYRISTCNMASFNTKLAIYSGSCTSPAALACNDNSGGCLGGSSLLTIDGLVGGAAYLVQVGAFVGTGTASLEFTFVPPAPPNDECPGAIPVGMGMNSGAVDTTAATQSFVPASGLPPYVDNVTPNTACDPNPFPPIADSLGSDQWFTFQPPAPGDYLFSTCDLGDYNSKMALFSGPCGSEVALACNNDGDGCVNFTSELRVSGLTAGQQYLLVVGGTSANSRGMADLWIEQEGTIGSRYCMAMSNSVSAAGATISGGGSESILANDLFLTAGPVEPGQPALFYYGPNQISVPFGDGLRCVGGGQGTVVRLFPFAIADGGGELSIGVDNSQPAHSPLLQSGSTWNFQAWYRDPAAGMSGFNLSDGLSVSFLP